MSFVVASKGNGPLTNTEWAKVIRNVFPVALRCKLSLMLDTNPWVFLLLFIVPVPARTV